MGWVSTTFERAAGRAKGYDIDQVDAFFERAREAYDTRSSTVNAEDVRAASFALVKGGYEPGRVDAALDRLEDAFSRRERDTAIAARGADVWQDEARRQAQIVVDRLLRPQGRRFRRAGVFGVGYSRRQVDALADRIVGYFREGTPLTVEEVRGALFIRRGNGYDEAQVDAVLDRTVAIILAVS